MPQLDTTTFVPQLVWLAITFIALYLILGRRLLPRIAEILESRQDKIAHDLAGAETAKAEAEEALATYDAGLAKARAEAQALHAKALEDAARETARALDEQAADLTREGDAAEGAIDAAKRA
ncbi:MAG TPA: F0F1 ATP synthase subunit B', partial [Alphaproteobacteria bacterium]